MNELNEAPRHFTSSHIKDRRDTIIADWPALQTKHWKEMIDVTLTMKQGRKADGLTWVWLDESECRRSLKYFMKLLNDRVYGSAFRRFDKRISVIPALEKTALPKASHGMGFTARRQVGERWHYHCAMDLPDHLDSVNFEKLITECWAKVPWAYKKTWCVTTLTTGGSPIC